MLVPDPDKREKRVPLVDGARAGGGAPERDRSRPREPPDLAAAWERERSQRRDRDREAAWRSSPWEELRAGGRVLRDELERERTRLRAAGEELRDEWRRERDSVGGRVSKKEQRRRDREERREARRVRRVGRYDERFGRPDALVYVDQWNRARRRHESIPRIFLGPVLLGLTIAQIAVALSVGVIVPTLLVILSLLFGRSLRSAAAEVRKASKKATRTLSLTRRVILHRDAEEHAAPSGVRVADPSKERVRVAPAAAPKTDADAELEAEAEREAEEAAHGRRRA
jgi:hypothetical protein